jgi:DNA helicase IV
MALDNLTPDRFQQIIINMSAERTAIVKGVAGSGKSLTLLKKAKQVSTRTQSYAIIVYTKSLKQFFIDELTEIGQSSGHVFYFKEWQKSSKPHYTYLFVDECQDFNAEEIEDFRSHGTYCWLFGDSSQSIMKFSTSVSTHDVQSVEATSRQLGVHCQDLSINHRLTIENAKVGETICPATRLSFACIKHGPKPRLLKTATQLDRIISTIQNTGSTDVGILVYYNAQVKYIKDYFESKGIPVQWKTKDEMEIDFKSTSPKVLTWHCAKGLQFNDVYLPCCGLGEYTAMASGHMIPLLLKKRSLLFTLLLQDH